MPKEIKMYEADDGKLYKSKQGAENWNRKLAVKSILSELEMTEEEIQDKLESIKDRNTHVRMLLTQIGPWTKWNTHLIKSIKPELWDESTKKTIYVKVENNWYESKEVILFTEENSDFQDPELHVGDNWKVDKVEDVNAIERKVYYVDKYTEEEKIQMKLESGEKLSEREMRNMDMYFSEVYREEGESRRWSKSILSVFEVGDKKYALNWEEGLTESQENEYWEQPYLVKLEEKEVVITKTIVTPIKWQ